MLMIDNITAFLWQDKAAAAGASLPAFSDCQPSKQQQQQQYHQRHGWQDRKGGALGASLIQSSLAALVKGLSQQLRCPVMVTKQTGVVRQDASLQAGRLTQRELLLPQWQVSQQYTT
jgi:hypothetical protein